MREQHIQERRVTCSIAPVRQLSKTKIGFEKIYFYFETYSPNTTNITGGPLNWASGFPANIYYLVNFNFYNIIEFNFFFPSSRLYNYTV